MAERRGAVGTINRAPPQIRRLRDLTQHRGYGVMNESPVGRSYRDAKILEIEEGTSEVQRMLTARELGMNA